MEHRHPQNTSPAEDPAETSDDLSLSRRSLGFSTAALAGLFVAAAPAAAQQSSQESAFDRVRRTKVLRCGVVAAGSPYYFKDLATGQWRGFYYELYKKLGEDLGFEIELREVEWGSSVLELQSNKIDIFFGLTPTPQRALAIDFSDKALGTGSCIIAREGFIAKTWVDLNKPEIRISVDSGSSHDLTATINCPLAQISRYKSVTEASLALQTGKADVQVCSNLLSLTILKKNPKIGKIQFPQPIYIGTSSAGFRRESDKTLQSVVNYALRYYAGFGLMRGLLMRNLDLVGISEADWPAEIPV